MSITNFLNTFGCVPELEENLSQEKWRLIEGLNSDYEVSNLGNIKSLNYKRSGKEGFLKIQHDKDGYCVVSIRSKIYKLHRLVAEAFIPNPIGKKTVNHINKNKKDNNVYNLEWMTNAENSRHSFSMQLIQKSLSNNIVNVWSSCREAERAGFHRRHIVECCNGLGKTHSGFKWSFV